ncbi:MAG: hypothetical protein ACI9J0_003796, partial [Cryomorphaceae bacterium]
MSLLAKSRETLRVLNEFRKIAPSLPLKMPDDDDLVSLGAMFEDTVERYPDNCML